MKEFLHERHVRRPRFPRRAISHPRRGSAGPADVSIGLHVLFTEPEGCVCVCLCARVGTQNIQFPTITRVCVCILYMNSRIIMAC